jgi:hypothetical protein
MGAGLRGWWWEKSAARLHVNRLYLPERFDPAKAGRSLKFTVASLERQALIRCEIKGKGAPPRGVNQVGISL